MQPWILVVLTLRNVLVVAAMVWGVVVLVRMGLLGGDAGRATQPVRGVPERGRMDA